MNEETQSEQLLAPTSPRLPFHQWARRCVLSMLRGLSSDRIILLENGARWTLGSTTAQLTATVTIHDPRAYMLIISGGSIGAAKGYFQHMWDVDDLTTLVRIFARSSQALSTIEKGFNLLLAPFKIATHKLRVNSRRGSKRNILAHYDLGNELYSSFLDPLMMYSSAIYPRESSSLEEASTFKLETICQKLKLGPRDRVIEIGSGWGGFAIYAAQKYGCHITTTTISEAQYQEAKKRIASAGLKDRITLLRQDYRDLTGSYDKLVSIEMIEAVGHRYLKDFMRKCSELLKNDGSMLLQAITIDDRKYADYIRTVDFIQHYIFPGGCLVCNSRLMDFFARHTDMVVRSIHDFGFDYARTLEDWRRRFNAAYPSLRTRGYDETFRRLWNFYLCYCEGGFLERSISVIQLVATKPGNRCEVLPS